MPEVLNRLHREHEDLSRLLDLLERELARFTSGDAADYETISTILRYCLEYPDAVHHPKEDLIYGVLRMRDLDLAAAVGDLEEDHRRLAVETRELAALIDQALAEEPVDRLQVHRQASDFIRRYRNHIAREESQMFPAARRTLSQEDWAKIDARLQGITDPLFGGVVADYYQRLRDDVDNLATSADGD